MDLTSIILIVISVIIVLLAGLIMYLLISPKPVVKLLRRQLEDDLSTPKGYDEIKKGITIVKDIEYSSPYGKNTLDLYRNSSNENLPLILWVHGGAFVAGDKSGVENWAVMLSEKGYAVAAMNYQWAPEAAYPKQVEQVGCALYKLKEISDAYKLNMKNVTLAGDSAGAHIATQFILIHCNSDFSQRLKISSPLEKDALKCALLYCGPYDLKSMLNSKKKIIKYFINKIGQCYLGRLNWKKSEFFDLVTPMDFVDSSFTPCYITDGNKFSFESHGKALVKALQENGVEVSERFFPIESGEVNHEYQMKLAEENAMLCFEDTISFLEKHTVM